MNARLHTSVVFGAFLFLFLPPSLQAQLPDQRIILVHGFWSSPDTWSTLKDNWPDSKGYIKTTNLIALQTDWTRPYVEQSSQLYNSLSALGIPQKSGWVMIAHSGGGLVSRSYVRNHNQNQHVKSQITIATPNQGTPLAENPVFAGNYIYSVLDALRTPWCISFPNCGSYPPLKLNFLFPLYIHLFDELLPTFVWPAMTDLTPGSAFLQNINSTPEPVRTAAIQVTNLPRAEIVKLVTAKLTNWSEAESERHFALMIGVYAAAADQATEWCKAGLQGHPLYWNQTSRWCPAADAFVRGAQALVESDRAWRSWVTRGDGSHAAALFTPADGIVPTSAHSIPLLGAGSHFTLSPGVHHLKMTRDLGVQELLGTLLETEGLAVRWHETKPQVKFSYTLTGYKLDVNGSTTSNVINAVLEYRWNWGDGSPLTSWSLSPLASHTYNVQGTFSVKLEVRERLINQVKTKTRSISIDGQGGLPSPVTSITITPSSATQNKGSTFRFTATPRDASGSVVTGASVSWSSSNPSVTITPLGSDPNKADAFSSVVATATIQATIGSVTGSSSVQFVSPGSCPSIHHVQVTVSNGVINVGQTSNLQAIPKDASDNTLSSTGCTISWSSTSQVSVSQDAQYPYLATATGSSAGTATVTATVSGISGSNQIIVGTPPAGDNARPYGVGNSFPPTMYQGQFYAVSVYMENTGGTTWSAPDYTLKKVTGTGFEPLTVQLSQSVTPGTNFPFSFNLYNDAVYGQGYDVQYQMSRAGSGTFGLTNGGWIDVLDPAGCTKNCGPTAFLGPLGQFYPGGALAGDMRPRSGFNGELVSGIIQSLIIEDYPLRFFPDNGSQVAYIRYFGALGVPWSVDVTFRIVLDPGTVQVGQVKKAIALSGYNLEVLNAKANELVVRLKRQSAVSALPDDRMIFLEIPLIAVPGKTPPTTLSAVELTTES